MTIESEIRLAEELATLKREHEQLRAAALRFYVGQGEPITEASIELCPLLGLPLDATIAELVRTPNARSPEQRHVLQCRGYADCTAAQRENGCPECLRL